MGENLRSRIVLDDAGLAELVAECRTAAVATVGPRGTPHQTALWYAVVDDRPVVLTKARSQKVLNLRRDPRMSVLLEAGTAYAELRGAVFEGAAWVADDPGLLREVAVGLQVRYPSALADGDLQAAIHNRVAVGMDVRRVRSWDHRKLAAAAAGVAR